MGKRRKKKRGRPATGHDPVVPVRIPPKLLRDIDTWAAVYRDAYDMSRSTAVRCLILLGLQQPQLRVIDPKDQATFEGATFPLLKFFKGARVRKWFAEGTAKAAKRKPPTAYKPTRRGRALTNAEVDAAVERAIARSKDRRP